MMPNYSIPEDEDADDSLESVADTSVVKKEILLVGIGWVIRCREAQARVDEEQYKVDLKEQATFQKRRKSMEVRYSFLTG